jgi:site-specific DNA-methyltransferase (adenine-specific)
MTLQLLHGDCLELMKTLPDKSIDLFVCDLPYGCLSAGNPERKRFINGKDTGTIVRGDLIGGCKWDIPIDLNAFWIQVKRLCKDEHTPVLMFCTAKFGYELIKSNEDWFRYDLVWDKGHGVSFLLANKMPMRSHELIYVFSKKGANYNRIDIKGDFPKWSVKREGQTAHAYGEAKRTDTEGGDGKRCVLSVIPVSQYKSRSKGQHSTQKPDDLYEWLITRYSKEGDTLLDATAGSFASCFTAQRLGRNAIGMELNKEFYDKAVEKNTSV